MDDASATLPYTTTRLPEPTLVATAGERKSGTHWDDPKQEGEKQGDITTTTLGSTTSSSSSFQTSSVVVGVSLSFLQDQLAQINADTSLTTADVVYQKIIPMLKTLPNKKLTYVMGTHPPYPDNPGNFGRATVFVSHAWRCSFGKLVTALERREQDVQVSEFYWLDIFSKDQFVINSEHTADELTAVVRATGRLLLVMDPWDAPICFTRVWCLFEIMWALRCDASVEVVLPEDQINLFLKDLVENGYHRVNSLLATIDARKGEASFPDDIPLIFGMIEESIGFDAMNATVVKELRMQMGRIALTAARTWTQKSENRGFRFFDFYCYMKKY